MYFIQGLTLPLDSRCSGALLLEHLFASQESNASIRP